MSEMFPLFLVATRCKSPYHVLITHGFLLDEKGRKMSKSMGNVIDPAMITDGSKDHKNYPGFGVDCLRSFVFSTNYMEDISIGPIVLCNNQIRERL
jgi:isoleucyl-tRNA synthetase